MKVIAINGSPRRKWNTAQLCQAALEGAAQAGTLKREALRLPEAFLKSLKLK